MLDIRTSLESSAIPLQGNPWFSDLHDLSSKSHHEEYETAVKRLTKDYKRFLKFLGDQFFEIGGISCFGLDLVVDEKTNDIYLIDLNAMPSYKNHAKDVLEALDVFVEERILRSWTSDRSE